MRVNTRLILFAAVLQWAESKRDIREARHTGISTRRHSEGSKKGKETSEYKFTM